MWVNGDLVATHEGGHTPFSSRHHRQSAAGRASRSSWCGPKTSPRDVTQPRGKQDWEEKPHAIWYDRTSGIWQAVWLEPVPESYIADLQLTPDLAAGSVKVEASLNQHHARLP